jgi:hypothetical protein
MEQVVDCSLQYRYPRLHEYRRVINWSMGLSYGEFVRGRNGKPFKLPEKSLFRSAVESSGWKLRSEAWTARCRALSTLAMWMPPGRSLKATRPPVQWLS